MASGDKLNIIRPNERNWIINPQFRINQRNNILSSSLKGGGYMIDRYYSNVYDGATDHCWYQTYEESTVTDYGLEDLGGRILEIYNGVAQTGRTSNTQYIEDVSVVKGKVCVVKAMMRDVTGVGNFRLAFYNGATQYVISDAVPSDGMFHPIEITFTVAEDSVSIAPYFGFFDENGDAISLPYRTAQIAQLQFHIDTDVAPNFTPRPYAEELALCQRYYVRQDAIYFLIAGDEGTTASYGITQTVHHPVAMRTYPIVTVSVGYYNGTGSSGTAILSAKNYFTMSISAVSPGGQAHFTYVADAEL